MFFLFILPSVYRAFADQIFAKQGQFMPDPDSFAASPEDQLSQIAFHIRFKLNDSQRRWLTTQSEALNISNAQIMNDILAEWLTKNPNAKRDGESPGDSLPGALEDFIARHYQEFLPVVTTD